MTAISAHGTTITPFVVGRRAVLAVAGEIDIATSPMLGAAIDDALAAGSTEVWVDLTATTFMESSGVHVLSHARDRSSALNRRLVVICPRATVRRIFEITGVLDRLVVVADRAAAHRAA